MLKGLVEYIVQQLADHPDKIMVTESTKDGATVFHITVDPRDRGKIIGKEGSTIKALRAFLGVIAPERSRIIIDLVQTS